MKNLLLVVAFTTCCCSGQIVVQSVLNGASFSGSVGPGTWTAIFGSNLSTQTLSATNVPLPTQLGGVTVTFAGIAAPLNYVSPGQINAIIPFEVQIPVKTLYPYSVPVVVTTSAGSSAVFSATLTKDAPALFTRTGSGSGAPLAFDGNFKAVSASGNSPIVLYATGLGATSPAGSSAAGGISTPPFNTVQDSLSVFVGDTKATIGFAGLAPGFPGVYQLNVTPNGPVSDRVYIQQGGWQSNTTTLPLAAAGSNVANVTGSVDGLFPATGANVALVGASGSPSIGFSAMFMGATFSTSFDILPNAKPFSVVAATDAGTAVINIDPIHNTYQETFPVPTSFARAGDLSQADFTIFDFLSCTLAGCQPLPGNIVPPSRMNPVQVRAVSLVPFPNISGSPDGINGILTASGSLPMPGHFTITNANFGAFFQIARPGGQARTATFSLYVDGVLAAGNKAAYTVY